MTVNINLGALNAIRSNPPPDAGQPQQLSIDGEAETTDADGIQAIKDAIAQGITSGVDPYPLLLKAVYAIGVLTGDRVFYSVCRDTMNGGAMLDELPPGWEQESVEADLQRLEAARRNIGTAIKAHRQQLQKQPEDLTEKQIGYKKRIQRCFGAAYRFMTDNLYPRTGEDWGRIAGSLPPFKDPLAVALVCGCVNELEREYTANKACSRL